jgi:hypothetical protein
VTPLPAHAGHWLVQLVYVAPLVFMGGMFAVGYLRRRRDERNKKQPFA